MKKILYVLVLFLMFTLNVNANEEDNLVNIYFFHSDSCTHCKQEMKLLETLEEEYDNIRIYKYEIGDEENSILLSNITNLLDTRVVGVPFTVIGAKYFNGYSEENSKKVFTAAIEYYSKYGYIDKVGEYITGIELPTYEVGDEDITIDEYIKDYGNYTFKLPLIGTVETKNLTLPLIAIVIGLVDGFNPCAMWILIFLISMLIGMKDKKKMFILGFSFLLTSAIVYFILMYSFLNVSSLLISIVWIRYLIGIFGIIFGLSNVITSLKKKEDGCNVVDDKKRNKIMDKIKTFTKEKNIFIALIGVITLAISVNVIELACSAGLPLIFTEILSLNNLPKAVELLYIFIYIFFFMIDDLIVFMIAMFTLNLKVVSTKYGKLSKIIGGIILFTMGFLLIFYPNIIMLNF